jgi:DNA-binding MarR family transcriptional regulator
MEAEESTGALTGNAGYLLSRVGTAVQTGFKELLARWQLRPQQFAILSTLRAAGETSQQQLCQTLGIDSGNMVELVDGLEALGCARRTRDPRDRRRQLLTLTAAGEQQVAEISAAVADYNARFLQPLGPAEQAALVASLTKLYAATPEGRRVPPRTAPVQTAPAAPVQP